MLMKKIYKNNYLPNNYNNKKLLTSKLRFKTVQKKGPKLRGKITKHFLKIKILTMIENFQPIKKIMIILKKYNRVHLFNKILLLFRIIKVANRALMKNNPLIATPFNKNHKNNYNNLFLKIQEV